MKGQKKNDGITLVALVVSIVVMLVLAGVSINAVVGDNGIITQAQSATYATSRAVLEEWINQLYVENYDDFSEYDNKMEAFLNSSYASYFYNPSTDGDTDGTTYGSVAYVVDSDGHALYLIKKSALPDDIKSQITGGDAGEGNYADYLALTDVYGVTSNLKVYYCSAGTSTILGVSEDELDSDNINRTVKISSSLASILGTDTEVTASSLRSVKTLTIDSSSGLTSLGELYNLTSLQELTIEGVTLSNLSGIQNCTQLYYVYFKSSTVGDYSAMANLGSRLQYLYFYDIDDEELATACTGLASAEFSNLAYFGVFGNTYGVSYFTSVDTSKVSSGKTTNSQNLTTLEPLSKLSSTTKSAVKYLAINNNALTGDLSYINGFTSLISLRCEYNDLTSLNGLNCASTLMYLWGSNNQLGATNGTDSEGNSATVAEDATNGTAIGSLANNTALYYVNLVNNTYLANVSYLANDSAIRYLYLAGCSDDMVVNGITTVIGKCGTNYSLPVVLKTSPVYNASDYYSIDSTTTLSEDDDLYKSIKSDLYQNTNITHLNLKNVVFETDDMYQEILETMTNLEWVTLNGCKNLTTIAFVNAGKVTKLKELDLIGTGVTDLTNLNSYATNIQTLLLDNSDIELTDIQTTINRCNLTGSYWSGTKRGIILNNWDLLKQLSVCYDLTNLYSYGAIKTGEGETLDLSSTGLKYINYHRCGAVMKFPSSVVTVSLIYCPSPIFVNGSTALTKFSYTCSRNAVSSEQWGATARTFQYLVGIKELVLGGSYQLDLSCLSYFKGIESLTYFKFYWQEDETSYGTNYANLTGVENLTFLKELVINYAVGLTDISSLASLNNLRDLTITYCSKLSDLTGIDELTNLTSLVLNNNGIGDLKPLENLTSLENLNLQNNCIYDTSTYTDDNGNEVTYKNLQIIADLYNNYGALTTLYISGNSGITDYSLITACTGLTTDI